MTKVLRMLSIIVTLLLAAAGRPASAQSLCGSLTQIQTTVSIIGPATIQCMHITSTIGPCIVVDGASDVIIEQSEIGPCGKNNSTRNSQGILIEPGSSNVRIRDNYIHVDNLTSNPPNGPNLDTHDAILILASGPNITIHGNVIARGESNVEAPAGAEGLGGQSSGIHVVGNYLLNPQGPFPRGQQVQIYGSPTVQHNTMYVNNNYAVACETEPSSIPPLGCTGTNNAEESISFGFTSNIQAQGNWIEGGHSATGCGIIAGQGTQHAQFLNNDLWLTGGGCTIGVADGSGHTISGNKSLTLHPSSAVVTSSGPAGIQLLENYQMQGGTCSNIAVSNNIVDSAGPIGDNYLNNPGGPGGCSNVTLTGNTFGPPALTQLNPMPTTNPPPLVPPLPVNCVAPSPYTTNTSLQPCWTP